MRCLALADGLADAGWDCAFATRHEGLAMVRAGLDDRHDDFALDPTPDAEPEAMASRWPRGCDLLVVDHYGREAAFESACRPWARRIIALDDLPNRRHDCDILLDQNLGSDAEDYSSLVPDNCRVLVGPENALLRPQFAAARPAALARRQNCSRIERILVSLGATDPNNVTSWVIDALEHCGTEAEIDVILGAHAPHLGAVNEALLKKLPWATLHTGVANVADMMVCADLAIGAAGSTSWERCCLGLPALLVVLADNQEANARELAGAGVVEPVGHGDDIDRLRFSSIFERISESTDYYLCMSRSAASLCDGLGVSRVIAAITAYSASGFRTVQMQGNYKSP